MVKFRLSLNRMSAQTILLFCIIFFNESIMFREGYSATVRFSISIGAIFVYWIFYNNKNQNRIDKNQLIALLIMLILIVTSCAWNGIDFTFDVYTALVWILSFFLVQLLSFETFKYCYTNIMSFISVCSIVVFYGYMLIPSIFSIFPDHYWHSGILIKNCFVGVVTVATQYKRNFGIFNEPGMFAIFLILALYFELFSCKPRIKNVLILIIALASTLSTNAYIVVSILFLAYFVKSSDKGLYNNADKKLRRRLLIRIVTLLLIVMIVIINNDSMKNYLFDKLFEVDSTMNISNTKSGSGYERQRSLIYAWELTKSNIFLGVGQVGFQQKFKSVIATATPLNWFALYGVLYGVFCNLFFVKNAFIKENRNNIVSTIILIVAFILSVSSQNMSTDVIVFSLIFYQVSSKKFRKECEKVNENSNN